MRRVIIPLFVQTFLHFDVLANKDMRLSNVLDSLRSFSRENIVLYFLFLMGVISTRIYESLDEFLNSVEV